MIINCKYCNNEFDVDMEAVELAGSPVKCPKCLKEWVEESKSKSLEKKLVELDISLHDTEKHLLEQKNINTNKIITLENSLKSKKEELDKQKLLEEKIITFEKRITNTEKEMASQAVIESKIFQLEKEIKEISEDSLIKTSNIENKTKYLEMKIEEDKKKDEKIRKNNIEIEEEKNSVVTDIKKINKFSFWKRKKENNVKLPQESINLDKEHSNPKNWDLSEETLEREINQLKNNN